MAAVVGMTLTVAVVPIAGKRAAGFSELAVQLS